MILWRENVAWDELEHSEPPLQMDSVDKRRPSLPQFGVLVESRSFARWCCLYPDKNTFQFAYCISQRAHHISERATSMLLCVASIRACISFTWGKNEGVTPGTPSPTNELVFVERLSVVFCSDPALNYVSESDQDPSYITPLCLLSSIVAA